MSCISRSAIVAFLCAASATAFAQCNTNDTTAPCFANVPDILGGRQSLLQDDDLVVTSTFLDFQFGATPVADGAIAFTNDAQIIGSGDPYPAPVQNITSNVATVRGRLFNVTTDQVVSIVETGTPPSQSSYSNLVGLPNGVAIPQLGLSGGTAVTKILYGTSGRFIGNGFDQMVFAAAQSNAPLNQIVLQAIGAANPNNPASGMVVGAATAPINNGSAIYAMTSGTFTDPQAGVAPPRAQVALLSGNPANGTGLTLSLYSVTANLSIVPGSTLNLSLPGTDGTATLNIIAIAAGRFFGGNHDQLAIAYASPSGSNSNGEPVELITIDFNSAGVPTQQSTYPTQAYLHAVTTEGPPAVYLQSGRFNWFGGSDEIAMSTYSYLGSGPPYNGAGQIQIFSFTENNGSWSLQNGPPLVTSGSTWHISLAAGRFDQMQKDPNNPNTTEPNPNLQLADITQTNTQGPLTSLQTYYVNPTTYAITAGPNQQYFPIYFPAPVAGSIALLYSVVAADIQGRSLAVGPPEKATVTGHIQPDLVLGLPPMHVDWITAAGGTAPQVLNLSVYPNTFNTAYNFASSSTTSASRSGTTSYTAATKETLGENISYSAPGIGSLSVQSTQAFGQMHQNVVAKKYNTYSGESTSFSTQTVFDDVLAASASQMNIYSYRLLGECIPATGAPPSEGCAAGTQPVYVQYSGPDNLEYIKAVEGRNVEWYQPVQEPGNLFSYPPNLQQLEGNLLGGTSLVSLSPADEIWDPQIPATFMVNWTQGGGSDVSSGTTASHSFDAQVSVSGSVDIFGVDVGASAGFGYNSSSSVSTLNESTSSLAASSGVTLNRGIGGHNSNESVYDYSGQSLIYGQQPPAGTIQDDIASSATVQAPGYLAAAHSVDMLSQGVVTSGNFWPQAYAVTPDLALNHPQRWSQHKPEGIYDQQVWFNCPVGFTSSGTSPSCTSNGQLPGPVSVADASFYYMKGLFVTPGGTSQGPQITSTTLGQKVNLRARIYNYSLANFPAGTVMRVQFYAQPWNSQLGQFTSSGDGFAPAVFIGEGTDSAGNLLNPVPAFCGGSSSGDPCLTSTTQNWEYAYATWDTSKGNLSPNSTWKFWVVVWAEYNGELVGEIAGHGLSSLPTQPFTSPAQVQVQTYSNNLGFYNQVFTILAPGAPAKSPKKSLLTVSDVRLRPGSTSLRDLPVTIMTNHRSSNNDIHSVLTLYYDGDPEGKGTLFDTQIIDRVPSSGLMDTARFTPSTCGVHTIFVRSIPQDGSAPIATAEKKIDVTVSDAQAAQSVKDLSAYLLKLRISNEVECDLNQYLVRARDDFKEHRNDEGRRNLERFKEEVDKHREKIGKTGAEAMIEEAEDILGCVPVC